MNWSGICFPQGVNLASRFVFSSLAALLATGCSSSAPKQISEAKTGKVYAIVADSAAFYRYGPQQGNGPDSQLPRDTLVTLIRPSFGYSKVQLLKGDQQGYVASDEIKVASAALIAAVTATPAPVAATSSTEPRGERFDLNSNDPRLVPTPENLPAPDLPPADAQGSSPAGSPPSL